MKFKKTILLPALFLLSLIPLVDLFNPGLPITHDGQDHVARIANFYQNLTAGNIAPRWAANLNWGYGHPILMFLYPLPSYIASFFHFFGFSFVDSTKIVFGLAFIASGFTMYLFIREWLGEIPGFVAAMLYLFAPYRFVDLYVRGAIGEHMAFIFPPLIFYFLLKLSTRYSQWYIVGGSLSLAGLILSHNAITLMFLPIIFLYAFCVLVQSKQRKLLAIRYLLFAVLGFGLASFFWVPAFFEGKYTLRDIVTKGEYAYRFVYWKDFLYGPWSYGGSGQFTVQVGIAQWIVVLLCLPLSLVLCKKKNKPWIPTSMMLAIFFLTLFFMTVSSHFIWEKVTTLQKFQFPWRFLSIVVFITALLGASLVSAIPKKTKIMTVLFVVCLLLWQNKDFWHAKGYAYKPETLFTNVYYGTTDTGESAPIWSVRFMEKEPKAHLEFIEGSGVIREYERKITRHIYQVDVEGKTRLRENTLYFPGWIVLVDGKKVDVEFQDQENRGLATFFVEKGKHVIMLQFTETKLRTFADFVTLTSLATMITCVILVEKRIWKRFRLF